MPLRHYLISSFFLLFAVQSVCAATSSQVLGDVIYGAGEYRAEVDGSEVKKISTQFAQFSLIYRTQGILNDTRLGQYTLMLGYEFNVLDPTITDNGVRDQDFERINAKKLLYQGEILLAPGGLPFRLAAYARDIHQSSIIAGATDLKLPIGFQGGRSDSRASLLSADLFTDINNGTHREVGGMLLLGIRNGSYLGAYRDVLSQIPRLLIDYKQIDVKDLSRDTDQQHYRARDLAFISLNKKDNWIHFRTHDYKDYLDSTQDSETTQVMIGTVDHLLSRQWINLTNWIKISGDLSFTTEKQKFSDFLENTYRVNLFSRAQKKDFNLSAFPTFYRKTSGEILYEGGEFPVTVNYDANRESSYRGSLRANYLRMNFLEGGAPGNSLVEFDNRNVDFSLWAEFNRTQAILFRPSIILSVGKNDLLQTARERLVLEWTNRKKMWTAGYAATAIQSTNDTTSFLSFEQSLYGDFNKSLSKAVNFGARSNVIYSTGEREASTLDSGADSLQIGSDRDVFNKAVSDRFLYYSAMLFGDHSGSRWANRLEVHANGVAADLGNRTGYDLSHMLKMTGRESEFSLDSKVSFGDGVSNHSISLEYFNEPSEIPDVDMSWFSKALYSYSPDRHLRLVLYGSVNGLAGGEKDYIGWQGGERLEYRFYQRSGRGRKIAELSEEFGVEGSNKTVSERSSVYFLRLAGAVYPTTSFYAKVGSEMVVYGPGSSTQENLNAEIGLNFDKLRVALTYGLGSKDAEGDYLAKVKEERWDVKVKKTF